MHYLYIAFAFLRHPYVTIIIGLFLPGLFRSRTCPGYLFLPAETLIAPCDRCKQYDDNQRAQKDIDEPVDPCFLH
jgi:hypothetical protein